MSTTLSEAPLLTAPRETPGPGADVCYRNEAIARKAAATPGLWLLVFGLVPPPTSTELSVSDNDDECSPADEYADPTQPADPSPPAAVGAQLYCARTPAERVALLAHKAAAQLAGRHTALFEGAYVPEFATVLDGDNPIVTERRSWQPLTHEQQQAALAAAVRLATT